MKRKEIVNGAEKQTIVKPTVNTDPEIVELNEVEGRLQDFWGPVIMDLIESDYVYIRMKNNHLEVGPANVEFVE